MFEKVEFYRVDIALLRELGHEVVLAGRPADLDRAADLYYCWWWGHAPWPLALGKLRARPVIVTGAFDYATCRAEMPGVCYLDRPAWQKAILRGVLRIADRNLFISRYEYDEVTEALRVNNPVCAPLAVDTSVYRPGPARPGSARDYFFSVAWSSKTNAIRKGLPQTIEAFARALPRLGDMRLVLAGKPGDAQADLAALAARLGVGDRVEFPGMIDDSDKLAHYRSCAAYVQPTLYEGFGHAIAEAVASGARVIAADRGAVPEVAGAHAIRIDPHDVDGIADAMVAVAAQRYDPAAAEAAHQWIDGQFSLDRRRELLRRIIADVT